MHNSSVCIMSATSTKLGISITLGDGENVTVGEDMTILFKQHLDTFVDSTFFHLKQRLKTDLSICFIP